MKFRHQAWCLAWALAGVLCSVPASAQSTITVTGVVKDATGVGVPGVTITATNQKTNASQTTTTASGGSFSIALAPGTYSVSTSVAGFRKATQVVDVTTAAPKPIEFSLEAALSEEITVTAMKREETVLNVPFSVAAPTEQVLRSRGVEGLEGIAANVGGFTVQNLGPGQSQVAMRGVSAGQIVRDQPGVKEQVGAYLDESVISLSLFTPDLDLFDTSRVEVLRGPQGTLFGSGSASGTVRYITNQPRPGITEGFAEIGANAVQGGNGGANLKFGFNVPLGKDNAARVAAYYDRLPGFIESVQPDLSIKKHVDDGFRSGVRAAVRFAPSGAFSITPRIVYQRVDQNGWNREDIFNILANPYTTTRPAVSLGERQQFTQLKEEFTDDFVLADLNLKYDIGGSSRMALDSITSYTFRDILVVRDATALTASITGGSIGLPQPVYTINGPLNDATTAKVWTQEMRLSGSRPNAHWLVGGFYGHTDRDYGQDLRVNGFQDRSGIPTQGLRAPKDSLFWSELGYQLNQFALFGETTITVTPSFDVTAGLRYYYFNEDKQQIFDGIFGNDNNGTSLVSQPGSTNANGVAPRFIATYRFSENANVNAQVSRGFRLGGINDPLNVPLCTPQDLTTFGGRETWKDEKVWNYELGYKSRVLNGNGSFNVSGFYMDIRDLQATVTAGSCSSRLIFNVPKARSTGLELEFQAAPNSHLDFAFSGSFNNSELRSTLTSTAPSGGTSVVSGIEQGARLPTVPQVQLALATTYQGEVMPGSLAYVTATYQHIGSRLTQVGDQDLGTLDLLSFGKNTLGGPLTATTFRYNPELPAYDLVNLRVGVRRNAWDIAVFVNNLTDEHALLSLDRERGTRARISYLTNQPRSFGISTRFNF